MNKITIGNTLIILVLIQIILVVLFRLDILTNKYLTLIPTFIIIFAFIVLFTIYKVAKRFYNK